MTAVSRTIKSITNALINEQTEILKSATLLMIPSLLTKITGSIFLLLIATKLGTSPAYNEFLLANAFPEMLTDILLTGAISTVIIPILIDSREKEGNARFLRVYNTAFTLALSIFLAMTVVIILFADQLFPLILTYIIRPSAENMPSASSITNIVMMMRVLMLPQLLLGISVFITSGLNAFNRVFASYLAPLFYNVGRILGLFLFFPIFGQTGWAIVIGVLIGSIFHLAVQLPVARAVGLKFHVMLDLEDKYVKRLIRLTIPRTLAYATETIGETVSRLIATGFGPTFYSVLTYANALALVIPAIFGYSFAAAALPLLSSMYSKGEKQEMGLTIGKTLNQIFFLAIPFVITLIILRLPIVRLVYGIIPGTQFGREDTVMVGWTLLFFALGLIFVSMKWFLYRVFFISRNTVILLSVSLVSLVSGIVLTVLLSNLFSHSDSLSIGSINLTLANLFSRSDGRAAVGGAALAFTITGILEFIMYIILNHKMIAPLNFKSIFKGIGIKLIPVAAMTFLMYTMYKTWETLGFPIDATPGFSGSTTVNLFVLTAVTVTTCFMVYYLLCYLFGVEELRILRRFLNPIFKLGGITLH